MSLIDVLAEYKKDMNIESRLKEVEVIKSWEKIAGRAIASRTTSVSIRDHVLYISLNSSVVRNELMMMRETIKSRLNELAGEEIITSIVLK